MATNGKRVNKERWLQKTKMFSCVPPRRRDLDVGSAARAPGAAATAAIRRPAKTKRGTDADDCAHVPTCVIYAAPPCRRFVSLRLPPFSGGFTPTVNARETVMFKDVSTFNTQLVQTEKRLRVWMTTNDQFCQYVDKVLQSKFPEVYVTDEKGDVAPVRSTRHGDAGAPPRARGEEGLTRDARR